MKKHVFTSLILLTLINAQQMHSQESLKLMTYNIKLDYPKVGENSWENRKPFFMGLLKYNAPDVLGVQEAMPNQMKDMDSLLVDYGFVGVGRDDGKDLGEYSAIFYHKHKLRIVESATFWLSQTPDKVSMGWDAACNRVCTYALFEDKVSNEQFWVFNTHFDHIGVEARKNSTLLILDKIEQITGGNKPVFLMGDFNMEPDNTNIQQIKTKLDDSKEISLMEPFGPEGTFNNFEFHKPVTTRIDYIFVSKGKITIDKYAVLSDNIDLKYPSDHLPILIEAKLNTQ
ncbi:MAG TPA: endonuclease/exonuclease/phosphatase family protein [Aquaticitalea sp.]|mgnify:CR=1 FL=1|nr:endonuclease/exonuclease/phosphatase family protein [Aquaticitalea sp.]